jgi:hypothetical protein
MVLGRNAQGLLVLMEFMIDAVDRDRSVGHEGISAIGNNRDRWSISVKGAIVRIEKKAGRFFIQDQLSGERAEIGVVREDGHPPYLRSMINGKWSNHLLALPSTRDCKLID